MTPTRSIVICQAPAAPQDLFPLSAPASAPAADLPLYFLILPTCSYYPLVPAPAADNWHLTLVLPTRFRLASFNLYSLLLRTYFCARVCSVPARSTFCCILVSVPSCPHKLRVSRAAHEFWRTRAALCPINLVRVSITPVTYLSSQNLNNKRKA